MYWLATIAKHRLVLSIAAVFAMGALFVSSAPIVGAQAEGPTTFGIDKFEDELALGDQDLQVTIARIINVGLSLLGIIAVVIILIGGFKWMTAGGNEDKVGEARSLIFSGIIGLAIILSAWAIARFVLGSLSSATGTGEVTGYEY